jgi:hypothetical protein
VHPLDCGSRRRISAFTYSLQAVYRQLNGFVDTPCR